MNNLILYTLDLEPVAKGRPRFTLAGHAYTPEKTRNFERSVRMMSMIYAPTKPLEGPIMLTLCFEFKAPKNPKHPFYHIVRPDVGNLVKGIEDALNGIMWKDDSQICIESVSKIYAQDQKPKVRVSIQPIMDEFNERK